MEVESIGRIQAVKITEWQDDMKIYAASKDKLERVMKTVKEAMGDVSLEWNEKKCSTAHVRRSSLDNSLEGTAIGERQVIENLKKGETYKFFPSKRIAVFCGELQRFACRHCQLYGRAVYQTSTKS